MKNIYVLNFLFQTLLWSWFEALFADRRTDKQTWLNWPKMWSVPKMYALWAVFTKYLRDTKASAGPTNCCPSVVYVDCTTFEMYWIHLKHIKALKKNSHCFLRVAVNGNTKCWIRQWLFHINVLSLTFIHNSIDHFAICIDYGFSQFWIGRVL